MNLFIKSSILPILILFSTSAFTQTLPIREAFYVSDMNFRMPALAISTSENDGFVTIKILGSILDFSENSTLDVSRKLKEHFNFSDLNALIIKLPKSACLTKVLETSDSQLLYCKITQSDRSHRPSIQGANVIPFSGEVTSTSKLILRPVDFRIEVLQRTETSATFENKYLIAKVFGYIDHKNIGGKKLLLSLSKPYISLRN